jgi:hypothetical protein
MVLYVAQVCHVFIKSQLPVWSFFLQRPPLLSSTATAEKFFGILFVSDHPVIFGPQSSQFLH